MPTAITGESPLCLAPDDEVKVVNGCLRVNDKPFIVENQPGSIMGVRNGKVIFIRKGTTRSVPFAEIHGAWA